jgi:putative ABC transport system permease protein
MSYTVAERITEIGIRMALGTGRREVTAMILALGVALSLAAASAASALLFGLKPRDPATLAIAASVLAAVALGASYLPARRTAALDSNSLSQK